MSLSAVSRIYYVCLHYILILIASGRIVQSHVIVIRERPARSLTFWYVVRIFSFRSLYPMFSFVIVSFSFFFNWRIPLSVFNSCAIFVVRPTKMMRNEGIIQFIKHTWGFLTDNFNCKHCNFQSSMFTSSFLEKCCISAWEEFSRQVLETAALD